MQQLLTISLPVGAGLATSKSAALAGRNKCRVDRIAVMVIPRAKVDGSLPTREQIQAVEDSLSVKIWRDNNQTLSLIPQGVPVRALQTRDMGPLPIQPFDLDANDQPTIEWAANTQNLFGSSGAFANASGWDLSVIFYSTDERK